MSVNLGTSLRNVAFGNNRSWLGLFILTLLWRPEAGCRDCILGSTSKFSFNSWDTSSPWLFVWEARVKENRKGLERWFSQSLQALVHLQRSEVQPPAPTEGGLQIPSSPGDPSSRLLRHCMHACVYTHTYIYINLKNF